MEAVLLYNGYAVRTKSEKYDFSAPENRKFSTSGVLSSFNIFDSGTNLIQYRFFGKTQFREEHIKNNKYKSGYYPEAYFKAYRNQDMSIDALADWEFKINEAGFEPAQENDEVLVERLYPDPVDEYFNTRKYTFVIPLGSGLRRYASVNDFPTPNITDVKKVDAANNPTPRGDFYAKNFGDLVNTTDWEGVQLEIPEDFIIVKFKDSATFDINEPETNYLGSKRLFAVLMSRICFRIFQLVKNNYELIGKLAITDISAIKTAIREKYDNNNSNNYSNLPIIDRAIGELLHDWGEVSSVPAQRVLPESPNLKEFLRYKEAVDTLYENLRFLDEATAFLGGDSSSQRIKYLVANLFGSLKVIGIEERVEMLKSFMEKGEKDGELPQKASSAVTQTDILRILVSVTTTDEADYLLDFLTKSPNGGLNSNFEMLYYLMDDARNERITIVEWFVDEDNNRQHFINCMYRIWKVSKFNPAYVPAGTTPTSDGLNPNSYFMLDTPNGGIKYYAEYDNTGKLVSGANPSLEYVVTRKVSTPNAQDPYAPIVVSTEEVNYVAKKFVNETIVVNKVENLEVDVAFSGAGFSRSQIRDTEYGKYHIYQPLCLIGYTADRELTLPNSGEVPAFMFFYAEEFERLKNIDAAISFFVDVVVIETTLFFLTGGFSSLAHLRHLRYVGKIRKLKVVGNELQLGGLLPDEAVLFWRGVAGLGEAVSVSSGVLQSFFQYKLTVENDGDPDLLELYQRLNALFLLLSITSGIGASLGSMAAVRQADRVKEQIQLVEQAGKDPRLSQDILNLINAISSAKSDFGLYLQNLTFSNNPNTIFGKYNLWSEDLKQVFFSDFNKKVGGNTNFWEQMNGTSSAALDRWEQLYNLGLPERNDISLLSSADVMDAYADFYSRPVLKTILDSFDPSVRRQLFGRQKVRQLPPDVLDHLEANPKKMELLGVLPAERTNKDIMTIDEAVDKIIATKLPMSENLLEFLWYRHQLSYTEGGIKFAGLRAFRNMTVDRLRTLHTRFLGQYPNLAEANQMYATIKVYDVNDNLVQTIKEYYVSGTTKRIEDYFGSTTIPISPDGFTPINPTGNSFKVFTSNAFDSKRIRANDTEVKMLFNFIENHLGAGRRFEIEIESTRYSCESCQRYMYALLQQLTEAQGKEVEYIFRAHPEAEKLKEVNRLLNE